MVKYVLAVDDSDLPILGIIYTGEGRIVASAFSFDSRDVVVSRLRRGLDLAVSRGRVLSRGRSSALMSEAIDLLGDIRPLLGDELRRVAFLDKLDMGYLTQFEVKVYMLTLDIPLGETTSYKYLAGQLETSPRAVGQALARNPFSPIIPCHRVIRSDGSLGGFSGSRNAKDKALMIQLEREFAQELSEKLSGGWRVRSGG